MQTGYSDTRAQQAIRAPSALESVMRIRDSREPRQTGFADAEIALLALDHSLPAELSEMGRKALSPALPSRKVLVKRLGSRQVRAAAVF